MVRPSNRFAKQINKNKWRKSLWATTLSKVDGLFDLMMVIDMLFVFVEYVDDKSFFGATVGRVTNRIKDARFELDGQVYELEKNDGTKKHHLHGVFNKRVWQSSTENGDTVVFKYQSPDGRFSCSI